MTAHFCKHYAKVQIIIVYLIVSAGLLSAPPFGQKPNGIEQVFDGFFREYIDLSPETGTQLGLPEELGIKVRSDELDDVSDAGQDKVYQMYRRYSDWLSRYDRNTLTTSQRINYDVLKWYLDTKLQEEQFRYHKYLINPMLGFHNQLTTLFTEHHRIQTIEDAENYIKRLAKYEDKIAQTLEQLTIRQKKGIMPPIHVVRTFQQALDDFVNVPSEENILFTSFKERLNQLNELDDKLKEELLHGALRTIENSVYPAYTRISAYVDSIMEKAHEDAGVWKLPNGDAYYRHRLRLYTTTDLTPEEIHSLGIQEVSRIQGELKTHFATLGISGSDEYSDLLEEYLAVAGNKNDRRFFYPATQQGREQTLRDYQAIIDDMSSRLPEMFSLIPEASVRVERVPAFKEKTMGTYYQPPKLDGSSSGIFYANLSYQHKKSGMKTLAYHEAVPGHHFQFAVERESPDSRLFKSLFFFIGYVEGWALYAEKLAKEYGFYSDIHSLIGNLSSELFRAVRLVVDTGIHSKRWTREQAYQYMLENIGWSSYGEIDRYIVWPGQACAYKIGELKIIELRERAEEELGDKFDIKDFHTVVLKHGSLPLEILAQMVEEYITATRLE